MSSRWLFALTLTFFCGLLIGCSQGNGGSQTGDGEVPPGGYKASTSVAQKGPLQSGSRITTQELDNTFTPTGKSYSYSVTSDLGTFTPTAAFTSKYVEIDAEGYYFDEVTNAISAGTIFLTCLADLNTDSFLNVNVLTTLSYQRIKTLVSSGMTFAVARSQAEREVLAALNIPADSSFEAFNTMDLSKGRESDQILAAASALFVSDNSSGGISALLASAQADIAANGKITLPEIQATLARSAQSLDFASIASNINAKVGSNYTPGEIGNWIDRDGDGVVVKFEYQVDNAGRSSTFTLPSYAVDKLAGWSVSVSAGELMVNGMVANDVVAIKKGDSVVIGATAGNFPNGNLNIYLRSGTKNLVSVSFVRGITSISLSPADISVTKGEINQYVAIASYTDGSERDISAMVGWATGSPSTASITSTGRVNAVGVGETTVMATYGTLSGSTRYNVTEATLQNIQIYSPAPVTGIGRTEQLTVIATYSDTTTADVTDTVVWDIDNSAVATVNDTSGQATGVSLGVTSVTAKLGAIASTVTLRVSTSPWSSTDSMIYTPNYFTLTALSSGKILLVSSQGGNGQIYDPLRNSWIGGVQTASMNSNTATLLANGLVMIAGGILDLNAFGKLYNPNTNTWSPTGQTPDSFHSVTATLLGDGRVLVAGGCATNRCTVPTAYAHRYDPITNLWEQTDSLANGRRGHTATLLDDGRVLIVGGHGENYSVALASTELYNPIIGAWSVTGSLNFARIGYTATLLTNGKVLVTGGLNGPRGEPVNSAELYNPVTGQWSATASMNIARYAHAATRLADGKVLVTGGVANDNFPTDSVEVFDPETNTWTLVGSLQTARASHQAALLNNGKVLVVGGYTSNSIPISTAELSWRW
jgi:Kelch motif/Bacterial Ig-like domain (group 2)/Galactose oxidase, central domain